MISSLCVTENRILAISLRHPMNEDFHFHSFSDSIYQNKKYFLFGLNMADREIARRLISAYGSSNLNGKEKKSKITYQSEQRDTLVTRKLYMTL